MTEKFLQSIKEKERIEILKNFINRIPEDLRLVLDDYFNKDILIYLVDRKNKHDINCTKCINWNYGRRWWICLKNHNIRTYSDDNITDIPFKEIIPFFETYAENGCPDYKFLKILKDEIKIE